MKHAFLGVALACVVGLSGWGGAAYADDPTVQIQAVGLETQGDNLVLQADRPLGDAKQFTLLKLPNPNRLIIDIPDARLGAVDRVIPVFKNGIQRIELSETRGMFFSATRVVVTVDNPKVLSRLNVTAHDNALVVSQEGPPVLATVAVPATPTPSRVAVPVPDRLTPCPDCTVLQDVFVRDGELTLKATPGQKLSVKNRFVLDQPGRLVLDLERATLANRSLLNPVTLNQGGIQQVRVGQFDDQTVRLVIETRHPERVGVVFPSPDRSVMTLRADATGANLAAGQVEHIYLDRENGMAILRVATTSPMTPRLIRQEGKLAVMLDNISALPGWIRYDKSQYPELSYLKLESAGGTSRLVLDLADPELAADDRLSSDGRILELRLSGPSLGPVPPPGFYSARNRGEERNSKAPFRARVVIDAGHGGKDLGANRQGINEKDLNLAVALRLKQALESRGIKVYMTRSTDVFLPLPEITRITNEIRPDLFVSVHTNSSTSSAITGLETYYFTPQSIPLARRVHAEMVRAIPGSPDRGVRQARFYVIHHTPVPAILCEMGYISNPGERGQLVSDQRQRATANAIAEGVVDYLKAILSAQAKLRAR